MLNPGDVIVRRRNGVRLEFLDTAASTAGARLRYRLTAPRGTRRFEIRHVHPSQDETITVRSGTFEVEIDGTQRRLGPRETLTIRRGLAHRYWSVADEEPVLDVELQPAGRTELMLEQLFGAENLAPPARPDPGFLQVFLWANAYEMYTAVPPLFVQRLLSAAVGPVARLLGYRVVNPEFAAAARLRPEDGKPTQPAVAIANDGRLRAGR